MTYEQTESQASNIDEKKTYRQCINSTTFN